MQDTAMRVDIEDTSTWLKYRKKFCTQCVASCCTLPVEVRSSDLIRMGLMDEFEISDNLKLVAKRLKKERIVDHYHSKTETFTLSRMANGDCLYLHPESRHCTIYHERPDTCRNHPHIGPKPGFCAFVAKR